MPEMQRNSQQTLAGLLMGIPVVHILATAVELGVFDHLAERARTAGDIARDAGTQPDATYRLLRALSSLGALREEANGEFSLTEMGELLRSDVPASFAPLARFVGSKWGAMVFTDLEHSVATGEGAFRRQHGESLFEWLTKNPEEQALFSRAMSTFSGIEAECILAAYDFTNYKHVVDVGGGHGLLLQSILLATPKARGTLFDLPAVARRGKQTFQQAELARRCEFVGGDFFEVVPEGGDLYLLKHVLHDWDDQRAALILRNVARAMAPGATLLIAEQGITPPAVASPGKLMDIVMLALLEGRERTPEELKALCEQAGLRFAGERRTTGPIALFRATKDG